MRIDMFIRNRGGFPRWDFNIVHETGCGEQKVLPSPRCYKTEEECLGDIEILKCNMNEAVRVVNLEKGA